MSLWCGGIVAMHEEHNGLCAICGDGYEEEDRPHEVPGKYATGIITRSYATPGQTIEVIVDIVANHKGFFVFSLCPNNNPDSDPGHECFLRYPLKYSDGSSMHVLSDRMRAGETRVYLELQLPEGLSCWQCILQWTWVTANRWGIGRQTGEYWTQNCDEDEEGKVGCGPQEAFRGCADICIGKGCPTERCQVARPFNGASITTTPSPDNGNNIPDLPDQLCTEAEIKDEFWSAPGDYYCKVICIGKPMYLCNLYLCHCNTEYHFQKEMSI